MKKSLIFLFELTFCTISVMYLMSNFKEKQIVIGNQNKKLTNSISKQRLETKLELVKRKLYVQNMCQKLKKQIKRTKNSSNEQTFYYLTRPNLRYIYHSKTSNFLYCKVPKNGSTNWVYFLMKLKGVLGDLKENSSALHGLIRKYYPYLSSGNFKAKLKTSTTILVARHPFQRLLSSYRDKLESYDRDANQTRSGYFYNTYGKDIVEKYRKKSDWTLRDRKEPTWSEFIDYIIDTPLFNLDEHFKPSHTICSPCAIEYDYICEMNNFQKETEYIMKELHLDNILTVEHHNGNKNSELIYRNYFKTLSENQIAKLYEKFKLEFLLYGYEMDPTISI